MRYARADGMGRIECHNNHYTRLTAPRGGTLNNEWHKEAQEGYRILFEYPDLGHIMVSMQFFSLLFSPCRFQPD